MPRFLDYGVFMVFISFQFPYFEFLEISQREHQSKYTLSTNDYFVPASYQRLSKTHRRDWNCWFNPASF